MALLDRTLDLSYDELFYTSPTSTGDYFLRSLDLAVAICIASEHSRELQFSIAYVSISRFKLMSFPNFFVVDKIKEYKAQ